MYIWKLDKFPDFTFQTEKLQLFVQHFALELGEANGILNTFSPEIRQEVFTELMLAEAMKTSEIEGEYFSREDVMSSLKVNLGMKDFHLSTRNKKANAIAQLMIEVQKNSNTPLTEDLLLHWHKILMDSEKGISAGLFRTGTEPMQAVSGRYGDFTVHYEAPPSGDLPKLISQFLNWYHTFDQKDLGKIGEAMLFSALVHLYFETLHPFEDGNGRIGRALAEKALVEKLKLPVFLSLSKAIEKDKKRYYSELKKAQRDLRITDWMMYFFNILQDALSDSKQVVLFTLKKANFFDRFKSELNDRQLKAVYRMMEKGGIPFEGGMTASKYMSLNKTSKATATRDLQHLNDIGALTKIGAGRSVSYQLNLSD